MAFVKETVLRGCLFFSVCTADAMIDEGTSPVQTETVLHYSGYLQHRKLHPQWNQTAIEHRVS